MAALGQRFPRNVGHFGNVFDDDLRRRLRRRRSVTQMNCRRVFLAFENRLVGGLFSRVARHVARRGGWWSWWRGWTIGNIGWHAGRLAEIALATRSAAGRLGHAPLAGRALRVASATGVWNEELPRPRAVLAIGPRSVTATWIQPPPLRRVALCWVVVLASVRAHTLVSRAEHRLSHRTQLLHQSAAQQARRLRGTALVSRATWISIGVITATLGVAWPGQGDNDRQRDAAARNY